LRSISSQVMAAASPRRSPLKMMTCQQGNRRSVLAKSRNSAVCSVVHTMTGDGFLPVRFQRATRSDAHTRPLGFLTLGSVTKEA
jgi:hypothetical protein